MKKTSEPPRLKTRRIHAYPASFGDDLANDLISQNTEKKDVVLDPFVGGSTSIIQARLLGRSAVAIDVDPIACLIADVVTCKHTVEALRSVKESVTSQLHRIRKALENTEFDEATWHPGVEFVINGVSAAIPGRKEIDFWFAPIQRVLLALLVEISQSYKPPYRQIVELAISSSIVHKWPYTLSYAMDIDHSRPHRTAPEDLSLEFQIGVFERAFGTVMRVLERLRALDNTEDLRFDIHRGDSTEVLGTLEANSVDYVVTSPPYFTAIDYPRAHKFGAWWLWPEEGLSKASYIGLRPGGTGEEYVRQATEILPESSGFIDKLSSMRKPLARTLSRCLLDLDRVIAGLSRVLKPNKSLTFVMANNVLDGVEVPFVELIAGLLSRNGFVAVETKRRPISRSRRRYPFGVNGFKGLMESEYLIEARNENTLR